MGPTPELLQGTSYVKQPGISNEIRRNFFSQKKVDKWNNLPDSIKKSDTVNAFKNGLDDYKAW